MNPLFNEKTWTPLYDEERRQVKIIDTAKNLETLTNSGIVFTAYGISKGEIVEFPPVENMLIREQATQPNGTRFQTLVNCLRKRTKDSQPVKSWFSLGALVRTDKDGKTGSSLSEELRAMPSNLERINHILGKGGKIHCPNTDKRERYAFNRETNTVDRSKVEEFSMPLIEIYNEAE